MSGDLAGYRPRMVNGALIGGRCERCGYAMAPAIARCPACGGEVRQGVEHAVTGRVWSSTVIHIALGDRRPPVGFAYVDVDDGPRILALFTGSEPIAIGTPVELVSESEDLVVQPIGVRT
jgi:uncharacterized protein